MKIKNNLYYLCIFFISFSLSGLAQTKNDQLKTILADTISIHQKEIGIEELLLKHLSSKDSAWYGYDLVRYAGWLYYHNVDKAVEYGKIALDFNRYYLPNRKEYLRSNLYNLGLYYQKAQKYLEAIETFKHITEIKSDDIQAGLANLEIGYSYQRIGDFEIAREYFNMSKFLFNKNSHYDYVTKSIYAIASLDLISGKKKDIINSISNLKTLDTFKNIEEKIRFNRILGDLYNTNNYFQKKLCLPYYKKSLDLAIDKNLDNQSASIYNNLGTAYIDIDIDSAFFFFEKALAYKNRLKSSQGRSLANVSKLYLKKKEYQKALKYSELALESIGISSIKKIDHTIDSITLIENKNNLLYILKLNGISRLKIYENNLNQNKADLDTIIKRFEKTDELIDLVRLESIDKVSKKLWRGRSFNLYTNIVNALLLKGDTKKAFHFIEKSKALSLLEEISNEKIKRLSNIPDTIVKQELLFKRKIANHQNKLLNLPSGSKRDSAKFLYYEEKQRYRDFLDSINTEYPHYIYSKQKPNIISLQEAIKIAKDRKLSFLQFIMDEEQGFGLLINDKTQQYFKLTGLSKLMNELKEYKRLITKPFNTQQDQKTFELTSKYIYDQLIPKEIRPFLSKKIVIIPDHGIDEISFDALVTESGNYLITEKEISYAYSISLLKKNNEIQRNPKKEFLGFAPINFKDSYSDLPQSKQEIQSASEHFKSLLLLEDSATKQKLIKSISDYKLIHIASHAEANDSITPWIAGFDHKLTLNDIYSTQNNAELVVLSACNTSIGNSQLREGIMSLARGFFNTGANSVVSTLWKADDKSTSEIITNFYKNIKKGQAKSSALRNAKINYLQKSQLSHRSPYYWSSLILIGDTAPIVNWNYNLLVYLIIIIAFFVILIILFRKQLFLGNK